MVTTTINRNAQRAFSVREWWNAKSGSYSRLCGEEFTHGEVVNVHLGIIAMYLFGALVKLLVSWMEGGAL